jgi:hypothetical protein
MGERDGREGCDKEAEVEAGLGVVLAGSRLPSAVTDHTPPKQLLRSGGSII